MRASGKESRKLYCTEEEYAAVKDYIAKRRAGEVLGNTDSTTSGSLDKLEQILAEVTDLNSEVYTLRSYTIPQLEQKINGLTSKIEQLSGQSY